MTWKEKLFNKVDSINIGIIATNEDSAPLTGVNKQQRQLILHTTWGMLWKTH